MPWEVGSTNLPFSKSPYRTVLPVQRAVVEKAKYGKDINSLASFDPIHKGSFEHKTNTKGKDTLLTRQTDNWSNPVINEPPKAS